MTPQTLMRKWLAERLPSATMDWIDQKAESIRTKGRDADLYLAFSLVLRHTGTSTLALSLHELEDAHAMRRHWYPQHWRVDETARLYLLLSSTTDPCILARRLEQLYVTADVGELVTLYRGLPLYPAPEQYRLRAAEGLRTNMKAVFEAVAHHNPYPAEQLPTPAWNQMILKALFIGSRLDAIVGLDERANPELARMLCDYAHERWSAGRPLSPELWRCVGPFATGPLLDDLQHALKGGTRTQQLAVMLALRASPDPRAAALISERPELASVIASDGFTWKSVALAA